MGSYFSVQKTSPANIKSCMIKHNKYAISQSFWKIIYNYFKSDHSLHLFESRTARV